MKTWTNAIAPAATLAALFTLAACQDNAPGDIVEPEDNPVAAAAQQDNPAAYARAKAFGCTFERDGSVLCPPLGVLNDFTRFGSVNDMPPPRKPRNLDGDSEDERRARGLADLAGLGLDDPNNGWSKEVNDLSRYVLENLEAEDAMGEGRVRDDGGRLRERRPQGARMERVPVAGNGGCRGVSGPKGRTTRGNEGGLRSGTERKLK